MNSKKETNGRVKMGQESRWAAVVYPTPERVELTVNSNKEPNDRVKVAKSQDGLLWWKSAVKTIEPNWAEGSQLGTGSSWAWPILTQSQIGPRSQYGSECTSSRLVIVSCSLLSSESKVYTISFERPEASP